MQRSSRLPLGQQRAVGFAGAGQDIAPLFQQQRTGAHQAEFAEYRTPDHTAANHDNVPTRLFFHHADVPF